MADLLARLKSALADRYRVERELGAGGMATVYLAQDLKHNRPVALKVLAPELAGVLGPDRFLREIQIAARLTHPHILPLHDSGEVEGFLYYVMPYVEGQTLRDRLIKEKQLPVDDALQIAREVADALSFAHSRDVIHRDIKPENILIEAGHAVVADFGIARAIDVAGGERLTETGVTLGTPQYMSPEQAAGDKDLDGRSDLYSLGCVLYEMLAGQPPFTGPTAESVIRQHLGAEPPNITGVRPAVPASVAAALQRALAKTPADRFNPVAQFGEAISLRSAVEIAATRRPRRLGTVLTATASVVVAAVAVTWWLMRDNPTTGSPNGPLPFTIVAEVEGSAPGEVRHAVRTLIATRIDQSGILRSVPLADLERGLELASLPGTTRVDVRVARELAYRGSIRTVVAPMLSQLGQSYALSLQLLDAGNGTVVATQTGGASNDDALINAVADVVDAMREELGERRAVIATDRPVSELATPSFEAYKTYVRGLEFYNSADYNTAAALARKALDLDPAFGAARYSLGAALNALGKVDSASQVFKTALATDRLSEGERLLIEGTLELLEGDRERAVRVLYRLMREHGRGYNNYALAVTDFGRFDDALKAFDDLEARSPFGIGNIAQWNRLRYLVILQRYAEAEAAIQEFSEPRWQLRARGQLALARGSWDLVDSLGRVMVEDLTMSHRFRNEGYMWLVAVHATRGQVGEARKQLTNAKTLLLAEGGTSLIPEHDRAEVLLQYLSRQRSPDQWDIDQWERSVAALLAGAVPGDLSPGDVPASQPIAWAEETLGSIPEHRARVALVRALVGARAGRWWDVVQTLSAYAPQGTYLGVDVNDFIRWLWVDAHDALGSLDSAVTSLEILASAGTGLSWLGVYRGISYSFAHQRLVLLYAKMGRLEDARRHYKVFTETFANPDPEVAHLLDEAREALREAERRAG